MSSDVSLNFVCWLVGPLIGGWLVLLCFVVCLVAGSHVGVCGCDVVETSYEGHMVDALASRADEGRWSLR